MTWTWYWTVPISAEFGDNPFFDWVRVVCVILGMLLLMSTARVIRETRRRREPMPNTQAARFASLALAAVSLSLTEIAVVGTPATPRLLINVACLALGTWGVAGMRRKQRNNPPD